jgi:type IV pilus assembly protein PilQ
MRLKHTLGFIMLMVAVATAASASQLTGVAVQAKGNTSTVTIRANGAFTHTEYRPTENLLLVDLTGVSAAKLDNQSRTLQGMPGVEGYRVTGYKGASGSNTTRVELTLAASAIVNVHESKDALAVQVSSDAPAAAAAPVESSIHAAAVAAPAAASRPVQIRSVNVVRGSHGLQVEVAATGAITPKVMKLTAPDRIVIDVANAVPMRALRTVAVHEADVKSIRTAKYSVNPPATRIVVDLNRPQEFEVTTKGNHATIALNAPVAPASTVAAVAAPAPSAPATQQVASAAPVVMEPTVTTRPATSADIAPAPEATPSERAATAAAKFTSTQNEVPLTNVNATMKTQPALTPAVMQAAMSAPANQGTPAQGSTGCTGSRFTGEPISVNLKDVDLRDFFRLIHEISGLNVILDPKITGTLTLVLDDVPWDQALYIVMKNNSLDCQLEGNVLRIAATATLKKEADDRRAQIEAQALAVDPVTITRYLSYAVAKDIVPTIKGFLSARGTIMADERSNSLVISDIPNVMPQVDRLIRELDRKTQEVEIEARVVAATRQFARDIGTQLAFGWGNRASSVGGVTSVGQSPILNAPVPGVIQIGTPSLTSPAPPVSIPFFSNLGVGVPNSGISFTNEGANYRLDFILTAAESRGLIKILSRPRIVTQNNIQAVVRQGQRIPVVTAAQLGGPPTVTYVDAFLRLTVKPQITAENTIFLNVDVENTVPDFSRVTATQLNPVLITQQATTQVLVTDGGTVVIGGVIQTQSNVAIQQVPLLGSIPVLGNLFKRRGVSTSTQELIFFLTPKIIQT